MFDKSWNSQMHQLEVAEMAKNHLHVFRVEIQDHGIEEVAFQGITREEAKQKLLAWLMAEPFCAGGNLMSFEDNPADDDPHLECAREIHELQAELSAVRSQARNDNMRADLCDTYSQWLLDIGKLCGCGHLDERLPRCVEEEFEKVIEAKNNMLALLGRVYREAGNSAPGFKRHALTPGLRDDIRDCLKASGKLGQHQPHEPCADVNCSICNGRFEAEKRETIGIATPLTCANCEEVSTNPGQFTPDGLWLCTESCRKELCEKQSYASLVASGGIVDAP